MNVLRVLASNSTINVGVVAWFLAQMLKTLFTLIFTRKLVLERMVGAGGMPSSHSALTSSIAVAMAHKAGFSSPEFGLSLAFAAVVMYDAMGVRRAAGEQAKVLNRIMFEFSNFSFLPKQRESGQETEGENEQKEGAAHPPGKELKEFLGHTPIEVLGGCLVGILVAVFMPVV